MLQIVEIEDILFSFCCLVRIDKRSGETRVSANRSARETKMRTHLFFRFREVFFLRVFKQTLCRIAPGIKHMAKRLKVLFERRVFLARF